jgi:hypothetical protein
MHKEVLRLNVKIWSFKNLLQPIRFIYSYVEYSCSAVAKSSLSLLSALPPGFCTLCVEYSYTKFVIINTLAYLLTPCSRVLLEKLTGSQLVK